MVVLPQSWMLGVRPQRPGRLGEVRGPLRRLHPRHGGAGGADCPSAADAAAAPHAVAAGAPSPVSFPPIPYSKTYIDLNCRYSRWLIKTPKL